MGVRVPPSAPKLTFAELIASALPSCIFLFPMLVIYAFMCYFLFMFGNVKKIIEYLYGEKPIDAAYLFGSAAKGKITEKSDIDLAILLRDDFDFLANYDYKLRLMMELGDLSRRRVDVVFIDRVDPILQYEIRRHGKLIFERDRVKRIEYEVNARKEYFDFLPRHKKYTESMLTTYRR